MPRKHHNIDRYEALGCMGCIIITVASIILIGFISWGISFVIDAEKVLGV